jgi:hypothetical protein
MIPSRNFPPGVLKLVEIEGDKIVKTHAEWPSASRYRSKLQNMRNDLLMINPKLDLRIIENNA